MNQAELQKRLVATFRGEAREHCSGLAEGLLELSRPTEAGRQRQLIEQLFREAHTLKGAARLVGERAAEAICAQLEEWFSHWKAAGGVTETGSVEQALAQLQELREALQIGLELPSAAEVPAAQSAAPFDTKPRAEAGANLVRVPAGQIDSILGQAEDLLALKQITHERAGSLAQLRGVLGDWISDWHALNADLAAVRRFIDQSAVAEMHRPLARLLHFLEETDGVLQRCVGELGRSARSAVRDHGWISTAVDRLLEDTKEILMQPCGTLLQDFGPFVQEASRSQGKEIELVIRGADTQVDRRVLEEVRDAVLHLVRNSIDHGIEAPGERQAAGKAPRATLTLAATEVEGGSVEVEVSDNGRGISPDRIRQRAVEQRLISAEDANELSDDEVLPLVFASGFSTRERAGDLSGRGLGLAIVKEKTERLGGNVSIESRPGAGTTFRLTLPITLARFRGVFLRAGGRPFVLPASYVKGVVRYRPADVRLIKGQATLRHGGLPIPLMPLADILRIPPAPESRDGRVKANFAVVVNAGRLQLACQVEEVPAEGEIVMKSLGPLLRRVRYIAGVTIVGAGQLVPVLNAGDLVLAAAERSGGRMLPMAAAHAAPKARRILIAEDSITSRSLFRSILQSAGYEVVIAVDGVEAMTALKHESIDLVISDVQMPRMDGFELTRRIRAEPQLATLPVILITSLASREDKEQGVEAGANAYVVKSSFDQSDLLQTIRRLL